MTTLHYCHFLNGSNQCCWARRLVTLICPGGMRVIDYSTHIFVKDKCALLTSAQNSHSAIKRLLNMICFGKYFILTPTSTRCPSACLRSRPGFCCSFVRQTRQHAVISFGADAWLLCCCARQVRFTPHNTWITCLATVRNKKNKKKIPLFPLWHKRMQTVTYVGGCGWTQQQPLLQSRFVGRFCVHNCSAVPS